MGFWKELFNFLGAPITDDPRVTKAYWEGVAKKDKANTPDVHKHVHLHQGDDLVETYSTDGGLYFEPKE